MGSSADNSPAIISAGTIDIFRGGPITIHSFSSPLDGEFVRSQIIETEHAVIVVDVQLLRSYARDLRRYVNGLGKPIDRVILTHMHPDHWFGVEAFADAPLYALPDVIAQLQAMGEWWIDLRKADLGATILDHAVVPDHPLREGRELIDGIEFVFTRVTGAECVTNLYIELPQVRALLAQDLLYNQVYPFVGELHGPDRSIRCFDGWVAVLQQLRERAYDLILPGHGEPTSDRRIFDTQITCLRDIEQILTVARDADDFKRRIQQRYPDYRLPLLLDMSVLTLYHLLPAETTKAGHA